MPNLPPSGTSAPIRVTFFGDSTCVGQGVSIYKGWVPQIAKALDNVAESVQREILVSNASVNGRTTRQALEDMPYHVQSQGVDILVVQFGLNDCNHWATDRGLPRVSLPAFVANLKEIVARAERFGAFRVLLNNNHPTSRDKEIMPTADITYEASNRRYNQAIRTLAQHISDRVRFQDIEARFQQLVTSGKNIEDYLLTDGLHLSVIGHQTYFDIMNPIILAAIEEFVATSQY